MNIDTLRQPNGSYRKVTAKDIRNCLGAGHVTHLQTQRGIIAIRPVTMHGTRGWNVDRSTHRDDTVFFTKNQTLNLICFVMQYLNGEWPNPYQAGDSVDEYANQGSRDAWVLAVRDKRVLIEYIMPNGTSALVVYDAYNNTLVNRRNISYTKVSRAWIEAMIEQGTTDWEGRGQRSHTKIPFPMERAA